MGIDDERPEIIRSEVDPDYECVRADAQVGGEVAAPPTESPPDDEHSRLCPDGYVPRLRRRRDYDLDGKRLATGKPAERNPDAPN